MTLSMTPVGPSGENLPALSTTVRAVKGGWTRIATAGDLPAKIGGKRVERVRLIVVVDGFEPDEEIHLDDVAMFPIE